MASFAHRLPAGDAPGRAPSRTDPRRRGNPSRPEQRRHRVVDGRDREGTTGQSRRPGAGQGAIGVGRVGVERSPLPILFCLLATLAAVALLGLAHSLSGAPVRASAEEPAAGEAVVRRFYDAANAYLETGSPMELAAALPVDVVAHDPDDDGRLDRVGLARRWAMLRAGYATPRLAVLELFGDGDRIVARIEVRAAGKAPVAGIPIAGAPLVWAATERFRLDHDTIVEHWPGRLPGGAPAPLPTTELPPARLDEVLSLARFTFPPGSALPALTGPATELLQVEAGALRVDLDGGALLARGGDAPGWTETPEYGTTLSLRAGDALLIPALVRHRTRNVGATTTIALGTALFPRAALYGGEHERAPGVPQFIAMYNPGRLGQREEWPREVFVEVLGSGAAYRSEAVPAALSGGRIALAPGESLARSATGGTALVLVEAGALGADPPATYAIGSPLRDGLAAMKRDVVLVGEVAVLETSARSELRNIGAGEAIVRVVAVGPTASAAPAAEGSPTADTGRPPIAGDGSRRRRTP